MKKLIVSVAAAAAFLPLCAAETPVEVESADEVNIDESESGECPFSAEIQLDLMSVYMWRGVVLDRSVCYQPSVTLAYESDYGTLNGSYWTSLDFTHKRNWRGGNSRRAGSMIEQDFYLSYDNEIETGEVGKLTGEIGLYAYDYPCNGKHHRAGSLSYDLYTKIAWKNPWVTPAVETYWACGTAHEHEPATAYWLLSLEKELVIEQIEGLKLTPGVSLGIGNIGFVQDNTDHMADAHTQMTDQTLSLKGEYEINSHFTIGANINYTWTPSHTLRQQRYMSMGDDNQHQLVWGGVFAKVSF